MWRFMRKLNSLIRVRPSKIGTWSVCMCMCAYVCVSLVLSPAYPFPPSFSLPVPSTDPPILLHYSSSYYILTQDCAQYYWNGRKRGHVKTGGYRRGSDEWQYRDCCRDDVCATGVSMCHYNGGTLFRRTSQTDADARRESYCDPQSRQRYVCVVDVLLLCAVFLSSIQ